MRRPFMGRHRPLLGVGLALNTALVTGLMSVSILVGATPAAAAAPGTTTRTGWVPLACNLLGGAAQSHIAVALTSDVPDSVTPLQDFSLLNSGSVQILTPAAQIAAAGLSPGATAFAGVVKDFEQNLTLATASFAPGGPPTTATLGSLDGPQVSPTQFNQVAALQSLNADGSPWTDLLVNGPSPLAAWPAVGVIPGPSNVFSFGPIPVNSVTPTGNTYGPAPGTGGGPNITSGTPTNINLGPLHTTGAVNQFVHIGVGDISRTVTLAAPAASGGGTFEFAADTAISFFNGAWSTFVPGAGISATCGIDTSVLSVPPPAPGYCPELDPPYSVPNCFVQVFSIPIVAATVVPEAPFAVILPLAGLLVVGTMLVYRRRRNIDRELP